MASLNMALGMAATRGRVLVTKATKKVGSSAEEEKGPFDWIMGALQKEDQLLETDPILKKAEETSPTQPNNNMASDPYYKKKIRRLPQRIREKLKDS